jgi:hypothetical protein
MRQTILRRLEALEKEERVRKQRELASLKTAVRYIWDIIFAYHLGGLGLHEKNPEDALAKALNFASWHDFVVAIDKKDPEIFKRYNDSYRRLFAKAGVDFDQSEPSVSFDAFVTLVNQLPRHWLDWLRFNLRECCPNAKFAAGANIPLGLSVDSLFSICTEADLLRLGPSRGVKIVTLNFGSLGKEEPGTRVRLFVQNDHPA